MAEDNKKALIEQGDVVTLPLEGSIVIEIAGKRNRSYAFPPSRRKLRGRWDPSLVAQDGISVAMPLQKVHSVGIIPGICIECNLRGRYIAEWDPLLETKSGRDIWERIERIAEKNTEIGTMRPWPRAEQFNATDEMLKEHVYWMARAVKGGHAELRRGKFPMTTGRGQRGEPIEVIDFATIAKMVGGRMADPWSSSHTMKQVDVVEPASK